MQNKEVESPSSRQKRMRVFILSLLMGFPLFVLADLPGIGYSFSRVVLMATDKGGATVSVINNSNDVYLMQTQIHAGDANTGMPMMTNSGALSVPFHVVPPLKRVEPNANLPLRILATPLAKAQLPENRESVFFISVKAIPSTPTPTEKDEPQGGNLVLALVNSIKLFYRPESLQKDAVVTMASSLTFRQQGDKLYVSNPSVYYATFYSLYVGGKEVTGDTLRAMVPPTGEQVYTLPGGTAGKEVRWRLIDEYGLETDEHHTLLQ